MADHDENRLYQASTGSVMSVPLADPSELVDGTIFNDFAMTYDPSGEPNFLTFPLETPSQLNSSPSPLSQQSGFESLVPPFELQATIEEEPGQVINRCTEDAKENSYDVACEKNVDEFETDLLLSGIPLEYPIFPEIGRGGDDQGNFQVSLEVDDILNTLSQTSSVYTQESPEATSLYQTGKVGMKRKILCTENETSRDPKQQKKKRNDTPFHASSPSPSPSISQIQFPSSAVASSASSFSSSVNKVSKPTNSENDQNLRAKPSHTILNSSESSCIKYTCNGKEQNTLPTLDTPTALQCLSPTFEPISTPLHTPCFPSAKSKNFASVSSSESFASPTTAQFTQPQNQTINSNANAAGCIPSRFCHICTRATRPTETVVCGNVSRGSCRKIICHRCFNSLSAEAQRPRASGIWECTHCRKVGLHLLTDSSKTYFVY